MNKRPGRVIMTRVVYKYLLLQDHLIPIFARGRGDNVTKSKERRTNFLTLCDDTDSK